MVRPPARLTHVAPSWTYSTVVNSFSPSDLHFSLTSFLVSWFIRVCVCHPAEAQGLNFQVTLI